MDQKKQARPLSLEDIFAAAAERVQAGEPVDVVIASYAPEYHKPLRGLLPIVETAGQLHHAEIPAIATDRRSANRRALLQAAAQKRAELTTVSAVPVRRVPIVATPTWFERFAAGWASFQASLAPRPMRLALTVIALAVLIFGPTTLVTQAQSAIPGDLTYPVKRWIRAQELAFTPVNQLAEVRRKQEEENRADIQKAQVKADQKNEVISSHIMLVFHGYVGEYWQIGSLHVMPAYQPDLSKPERQNMTITGELQPGAVVMLTYQILPGQPKVQDTPVVQGIALEVMKQQPTEQEVNAAVVAPTTIPTIALPPLPTHTPLPLPTDTPVILEPTATFEPSPTCTVTVVSGWVPHNVQAGDTLAALAARFGVSVGELRAVNCFATDQTLPGSLLLVPDNGLGVTPEATADAAATVTDVSPTTGVSPTVASTATPPPATTEITPTVTSPFTATVAPPTTPTAPEVTSTSVVTPTGAATPTGTPAGTVAPTITSVATLIETATPGETPTASATATLPTPTEEPATAVATATAAATVLPVETATEEGVSGSAFTPEAEPPTAEPTATDLPPTEPPTATPLPPPTDPPPLPTATPAAARAGVMAAEALPATAEVDPAEPSAAIDPTPEPISQPDSPLGNP